MFSRFKSALYNAVGVEEDGVAYGSNERTSQKNAYDGQNRYLLKSPKEKHLTYCRPAFLQLSSADEVSVTADHAMRPIICPRSFLPWDTGYAEAVNAGKSRHNEDQGCVYVGYLTRSLVCKPPSSSSSVSTTGTVGVVHSSPPDVPAASPASDSTPSPVSCVDQDLCDASVIATEGMINGCIGACDIEDEHQTKSKESFEASGRRNNSFTESLQSPPNSEDKFDPLTSEVAVNSVNLEDNIINDSDANHFSLENPFAEAAADNNFPKAANSNCIFDAESTNTPALNSNACASDASPSGTPHFCPSVPDDKLFVDEGRGRLGVSVPYYYFAVFDGHAGWGAAVYASQHLHHILHTSLTKISEFIIPDLVKREVPAWQQLVSVDVSSVVVGALEQAFHLMDKKIEQDRHRVGVGGGCTACIALFIMGKLYVANAGDSRATACLHGLPHSMSYDFTPETENYRIRKQGAQRPDLLGGEYTPVEFVRRPLRRELGVSLLCRHPYMARGWVYKKITEEDLKVPLVCGSGKRSRVMATIGVTRGFGDHDLKAQLTNVHIKPFLSCEPEVRILNLETEELCDTDVLILATDGLWDIVTNEKAVSTLLQSMSRSLLHFPSSDPSRHKYRYMSAAQDLVMGARGKLTERNWRTSDNKHATIDDIAVFVVPLKPYQEEHRRWKELFESRITTLINGSSPAQPCDAPPSAVLPCTCPTETGISPEVPCRPKAQGKEVDCSPSQTTDESRFPEANSVKDVNLTVPAPLHEAKLGAKQSAGPDRCSESECKDSPFSSCAEANHSKAAANSKVPERFSELDPLDTFVTQYSETQNARTTVILDDKSSVLSGNSHNFAPHDASFCSATAEDPGCAELTPELTMGGSSVSSSSGAATETDSKCVDNTKASVCSTSSSDRNNSTAGEVISTTITDGGTSTSFAPRSEQFIALSGNPVDETFPGACQDSLRAPDDHLIGLSSVPASLVAQAIPEAGIPGIPPESAMGIAHADQH